MIIEKKISKHLTKIEKVMLFLLYAGKCEPITGKTKLQKEMFLVANYLDDIKNEASYLPHNHGAYSEVVELTMDRLKSYELAEEKGNNFIISRLGKRVINIIEKDLSNDEKEAISDFKEFMNQMTYMESLVYSYFSFPEFTTDSTIIEKVKQNRVKCGLSMYKRGIINLEKAAFISDLSPKNFIGKLKNDKTS